MSATEQALPTAQRIIDDPLAYQMLPAYAKLFVKALNVKPIRQALFSLVERSNPGVQTGILCRKRYIEDKLKETFRTEIDSLVLLGAGLDTLAYRLPQLPGIRVYEVDLPENIAYKRKKLEALYGSVPAHVRLVAIDFETQQLEVVLKQSGYTLNGRSFFVWEGVTQYLTEAAVRETFSFLAKTKPGSRLVFTYILQDFIAGTNTYGLDALYQRFRVHNPIWRFGLQPQAVAPFLEAYSWKELEQVGAAEFSERYLKPVGRLETVAAIERVVYAKKVGADGCQRRPFRVDRQHPVPPHP